MNKKRLWIVGLFVVIVAAVVLFIMQRHSMESILSSDARDVAVVNIERVDFVSFVNSKLAWVPGEQNSVAAIVDGLSDSDVVRAYNLETKATKELYDLGDYGLDAGVSINFFWSADGKRIVLGSGGIANLDTKTGHWIKLPEGYHDPNVLGASPDGKRLFVLGYGNPGGFFFMDVDSEEYHLFNMNPKVFSPHPHPLAWSPDGNWIAVETYDPDHPPKTIAEKVPGALYLLRADGQEARLIARNIDGDVKTVTFSPDGSKLIWEEIHENGDQSIFIANLDGSGSHRIFSSAGLPPEQKIYYLSNLLWSPDGSRIVYVGPPDKDYNYPFWVLTLGKAGTPTSTTKP